MGVYGREETEAWGGMVSWSIRLDVRFLVTAGTDPKRTFSTQHFSVKSESKNASDKNNSTKFSAIEKYYN